MEGRVGEDLVKPPWEILLVAEEGTADERRGNMHGADEHSRDSAF